MEDTFASMRAHTHTQAHTRTIAAMVTAALTSGCALNNPLLYLSDCLSVYQFQTPQCFVSAAKLFHLRGVEGHFHTHALKI